MSITAEIWCGAPLVLMGTLAGFTGVAAGQGTGTLEGRVLDGRTRKGLTDAVVTVIGQAAEARSGSAGYYRLDDVPNGTHHLRVERRGYATVVEPVEIRAGARATVSLFSAGAVLEAVVGHGRDTGGELEEAGSRRVVVRPQDAAAPGPGVSTATVGRLPGVRVIARGQVGSGSTIQIRGAKSFIATSGPVIYLDGVRMSGGDAARPVRGYVEPSILDLMDPASIERIEVLTGAAAGMLYGEGAGNGVILIYSRRGRP